MRYTLDKSVATPPITAPVRLHGIRGLLFLPDRVPPRPHLAMAVTTAASLPRLSLPPPATRSTVTSSRLRLDIASVPSCRRLSLRFHRSLVVPASAASSPSVPSSSPEGSGIGDALGGVAIFSAATGEPVLIRDLWDQNEVEMSLFSPLSFSLVYSFGY
jgi:hypothetical protein